MYHVMYIGTIESGYMSSFNGYTYVLASACPSLRAVFTLSEARSFIKSRKKLGYKHSFVAVSAEGSS
jgi:hypothetical protein